MQAVKLFTQHFKISKLPFFVSVCHASKNQRVLCQENAEKQPSVMAFVQSSAQYLWLQQSCG